MANIFGASQNSSALASLTAPNYHIGLDIGTTNSAISFLIDNRTDHQPKMICRWHKDLRGRHSEGQVPTQIVYDKNRGKICGWEAARMRHENKISNIKLYFDRAQYNRAARDDLMSMIQRLIREGYIKEEEDVIIDYLTFLFTHTKKQLQERYGMTEDSNFRLSFSVPVTWHPNDIGLMTECILEAWEGAELNRQQLTCDIFCVNEAEASALFAVVSQDMNLPFDTTLLFIDIGGGTADLGVYSLGQHQTLRLTLSSEVMKPDGEVVPTLDGITETNWANRRQLRGDTVNHLFRRQVMKDLRLDTYLAHQLNASIGDIVDQFIMDSFEKDFKPFFALRDHAEEYEFSLLGLRETHPNGWRPHNAKIRQNAYVVSHEDMLAIFTQIFQPIGDKMVEAIDTASYHNIQVQALLMGGFSECPAMREYLEDRLLSEHSDTHLIPFSSDGTGTANVAVAKGAAMRGSDMTGGPKRLPEQSIGVAEMIPKHPLMYDKDVIDQPGWKASANRTKYNTVIRWIVKKHEGELDTVHRGYYTNEFVFEPSEEEWVGHVELYASDECTRDYFAVGHPLNKDKCIHLGQVQFDFATYRAKRTSRRDFQLKKYCQIDMRINFAIIDRHIEIMAEDANDPDADPIKGDIQYVPLVSAFAPGTA